VTRRSRTSGGTPTPLSRTRISTASPRSRVVTFRTGRKIRVAVAAAALFGRVEAVADQVEERGCHGRVRHPGHATRLACHTLGSGLPHLRGAPVAGAAASGFVQSFWPSLLVATLPPAFVQAAAALGSFGSSRYIFDLLEFKLLAPSAGAAAISAAVMNAADVLINFIVVLLGWRPTISLASAATRYAVRFACHSPLPNWLRLTMPLFWSLAAPSSTVPAIAPSSTRPSKQ